MRERTYLVKSTINLTLDLVVKALNDNTCLLNDIELAKLFKISRSTIREVVSYLLNNKIIERLGKHKIILRAPEEVDYFSLEVTDVSKERQIEIFFLNLIMSGELMPGARFSESELAQKSGCTTITVREFLNRFSSYALIEKVPRSGWKVVELDESLILELTSFREMVELRSISDLLKLPADNPVWDSLRTLLIQHQEIKNDFDTRYMEFPELDKRLHFTILNTSKNRYTNKFYDIVFFICNYYFLWDKQDKLESIRIAIDEHIDLLSHMISFNNADSILTMKTHMSSTQKNLLNCVNDLTAEV